ncbi:MAG: hypothetical protein H6867_07735 [Rhodospirillales bacterium]|nr:hypothetical protein [Rhodospirillales bacterium]MCB9995443.1 hypothetical protein [Rhodospirillales bacterium]
MSGDSYVVKPLLADDADGPRNVAFVRGRKPVLALRQMFAAISRGDGVNAAIWQDAQCHIEAADLDRLVRWCKYNGISVSQEPLACDYEDRSLSRLFNKLAGKKTNRTLLTPLQEHIARRISILKEAFPDHQIRLSIDAGYLRGSVSPVDNGINPHVDKGTGIEKRFIETIADGATCLIDNDHVSFGSGLDKIVVKDSPVTLWQVETGKLALLSSLENTERPVMHTPPPKDRATPEYGLRIVLVYDLVKWNSSLCEKLRRMVLDRKA